MVQEQEEEEEEKEGERGTTKRYKRENEILNEILKG